MQNGWRLIVQTRVAKDTSVNVDKMLKMLVRPISSQSNFGNKYIKNGTTSNYIITNETNLTLTMAFPSPAGGHYSHPPIFF